MFETGLRNLAATLKLTCRALALVLCLAGGSSFVTAAPAAEPSQLDSLLVPALSAPVPALSVAGETVSWAPTGAETYYEVAISNAPRGAAGRATEYLSIARKPGETQTYTPTLSAGQTVYVGVSADNGPDWSTQEAIVTAPSEPSLSVNGTTVAWTAIPGVSSYTFATILNPTTTRETTYRVVTGTSYTPPVVPGQTVGYGLSASVPGEAPWAREVTIAYPPPVPPPPPTPAPPPIPPPPPIPVPPPIPAPLGKIIGTNDGAGWGAAPARTILAGHITWNRVEIGAESNTVPASLSDGFKVLAIAGNVANDKPLSQVVPSQWGAEVAQEIQANPGIAIAEAGNEMYFKGGVADPVQYGRMYLAAVDAMDAAGVHIPLLFDMWGNYLKPSSGVRSMDASGGGWLRDAVNGVPGLAAAIRANGLSTHPYGALGEDDNDAAGIAAVPAQEAVAQAVLGSIPPFYVTELGYAIGLCGAPEGACSQLDQATKMQAAYAALLADPHVAGIWWYQSHDDGNGGFGFMNADNTTRPSFGALSAIAQAQGQ